MFMKQFILPIAFCCICSLSSSQNDSNSESITTRGSVVRLNFLGIPAFGYEKGLGNQFTFRPEAGLGWLVMDTDENKTDNKTKIESFVNPYLLLEGRYYYNLERRIRKGRNVAHFAADYVSAFYRYNAYEYQPDISNRDREETEKLLRDVQYIGFAWGMQRSLWKNQLFYFNWSVGPSIKTNFKAYAEFAFAFQLGFGLQW